MASVTERDREKADLVWREIGEHGYETHVVREWIATALAEAREAERERCAVLVETWAQDNETIQPSFTKIAAAIRSSGPSGEKGKD